MIVSVDKGTTYTKTSTLVSFKSTIREYDNNELDFGQDKIIVQYNNKQYVIGEDGKTNTNLFKSQHGETKLLILTGIALSNPHQTTQNICLMTGLPVARIGYEKDTMQSLFQYTHNSKL